MTEHIACFYKRGVMAAGHITEGDGIIEIVKLGTATYFPAPRRATSPEIGDSHLFPGAPPRDEPNQTIPTARIRAPRREIACAALASCNSTVIS